MYVQLKSSKLISVNGKMTPFHPGDWVDVGRQTAMLWLTTGEAALPFAPDDANIDQTLVVSVRGGGIAPRPGWVWNTKNSESPEIPWRYNLILDDVTITAEIAMVGISLMQSTDWQIIAPLRWDVLANTVIQPDNELMGKLYDLRVPTYDTGMMFVKRTPETIETMRVYLEQRQKYPSPIAFLLALWEAKPLILPVPMDWIGAMEAQRV